MSDQNLVVGVGSIAETDPVLPRAIELAHSLGARLHVVHGYLVVDPMLDAYTQAGYLSEAAMAELRPEYEQAIGRQVHEAGGADMVQVHVVPGTPAMALLDTAQAVDADLLIVGSTRHDRFPLSLLGSTARTIVRQTERPVLMVRSDRSASPERVLLATDLSPASARAIEVALKLTEAQSPAVRALLAVDETPQLLSVEHEGLGALAAEKLGAFLEEVVGGRSIEKTVRHGRPTEMILQEAEEWGADLIALGTHGRKGFERFLLGSVAERILGAADCHVLIARHAEEE